jgi:hypothetical protein
MASTRQCLSHSLWCTVHLPNIPEIKVTLQIQSLKKGGGQEEGK